MTLKKSIISRLNRLPYIKTLYQENSNFKKNCCFPAGHYYSTIISVEDIQARETEIWSKGQTDGIAGIDLQSQNQIQLAKELSAYYSDLPFGADKKEGLRYYFGNGFYSYTD